MLPSDNRYISICCCSTRLQSSFIPQAVSLLNSPLSQTNAADVSIVPLIFKLPFIIR